VSSLQPPLRPLPPGATDCHAHVFGPYQRFPLAVDRSYTPPEAPVELYLKMLASMGLSRGVLVHASAYGLDWSAMLDALSRESRRLRGIAVVDAGVTDAQLAQMHGCGVRGVRFTEAAGSTRQKLAGSVGLDQFDALAPRLRELGWHAEIWAGCDRLVEEAPRLLRARIPLVFDHMGVLEVTRGVADSSFRALVGLLEGGQVWIKLSAPRNSQRFPDYEDVRPFHDAYVRANPERLVWGSDWPFLRMADKTPAAGHLLDLLDSWIAEAGSRQKVLVDNATVLYDFAR
jgi:2-pyrone-4,6-dicarboxylate lactonase